MIAIDCSNYTTGFDAHALSDAGVGRVIVQLVNERIDTHIYQITNAIEAGVEVEAYVYQWFSGGHEFIRQRMEWAIEQLSYFPEVRRIWLDCEQSQSDNPPYDGSGDTLGMIREAMKIAEDRGFEVGIYTGAWWWSAYAGEELGCPLWLAQYDGIQALDCGIGGWNAEMKQYAGIGTIAGVNGIDFNWYVGEDEMSTSPTVIKAVNADAFALLATISANAAAAASQQDGQFIGIASPGEPGYTDIVVRVKD